jgi:hypothetical protein
MRTVEELVWRYAIKEIGKDESEIAGFRIIEAPTDITSRLRIVFEVIIHDEHVRYIRRGIALLGEDGVRYKDVLSATRLTVPVETVPLLGEIYTIDGEGPLVIENRGPHATTVAREIAGQQFAHYITNGYLVEASCFFSNEGLRLAGVLVATSEQLVACGADAEEMANGCKFDTWEWGNKYHRKGGC